MVLRSYDAHDLVNLPSMTAQEAAALGSALLAEAQQAADTGTTPELVAKAEATLRASVDALVAGMEGKLPAAAPAPALGVGEADRDEDAAWGALYRFLVAFSQLPDAYTESASAARLLGSVFPTGLKFTQLASRAEWTEAEARRSRMSAGGLDAEIESLGGAPFVAWLKSAHASYGAALGITEAKAVDPKAPLVGDLRREVFGAIRAYVIKVTAFADDALEATAETRLRPLTEWQARRANGGAPSVDAAPPTVVEPEPAA